MRVAEATVIDVNAPGLWPGKNVNEFEHMSDVWEVGPEHQDYLARIHKLLSAQKLGPAAMRRVALWVSTRTQGLSKSDRLSSLRPDLIET
jgi:hypothetical protein